MEIAVPRHLIKEQKFEDAVLWACDVLYAKGEDNYFHNKMEPPVVELVAQGRMMSIAINCKDSTVILSYLG